MKSYKLYIVAILFFLAITGIITNFVFINNENIKLNEQNIELNYNHILQKDSLYKELLKNDSIILDEIEFLNAMIIRYKNEK